jgi:PIN domain nuclease of toxin-antitoxin system
LTLLDAFALVAFLADEEGAAEVEALLREGPCAATSVNLSEAVDVCLRTHLLPRETVVLSCEPLLRTGALQIVSPSEEDAWEAGALRAARYERKRCPLSLADCFLMVAARSQGRIATSDPHVVEIARDEGTAVVPLPDSTGRRPA